MNTLVLYFRSFFMTVVGKYTRVCCDVGLGKRELNRLIIFKDILHAVRHVSKQ